MNLNAIVWLSFPIRNLFRFKTVIVSSAVSMINVQGFAMWAPFEFAIKELEEDDALKIICFYLFILN
jgi:hypothetical protein